MALVGYGTMVNSALDAADLLAASGVSATVADMRQAPTVGSCSQHLRTAGTVPKTALHKGDCRGTDPMLSRCRFCKPLDMPLLRQMAREHSVMITIEENGIGGFGSHGALLLAEH